MAKLFRRPGVARRPFGRTPAGPIPSSARPARPSGRRIATIVAAVAACLLFAIARRTLAVATVTLHVDDNSPCVSGCGSQASPFRTIAAALTDANSRIVAGTATDVVVQVIAGNYAERIHIPPDVHVVCESPTTVTINAAGLARSAVIFSSLGTGRPTTNFGIDGCRITGGMGDPLGTGSQFPYIGGGGLLVFGTAVISNNLITGNVIGPQTGPPRFYGAGMFVAAGQPLISGNTISGNIADPPAAGGQTDSFALGGGFYTLGPLSNTDAAPILEANLIMDNVAGTGADVGRGGGIYLGDCSFNMAIRRNLIVGNRSSYGGGGIELGANGVISDNLIYGNSTLMFGGGIDVYIATAELRNNTIFGNSATQTSTPNGYSFATYGGGVEVGTLVPQVPPEVTLRNNIIVGNTVTANGTGGGLHSENTSPLTFNNDFFGNLKFASNSNNPPTTNNIEGDFTPAQVIGVNGNVSVDPLFVNAPAAGDATIAAGTTTTVIVRVGARYAVNQRIEYNNDGMIRTITGITPTTSQATLTFAPALASVSQANKLITNWGASTNPVENFRLAPGSPLIDAGSNTNASTFDLDGNPRVSDGDNNGTLVIDMGAYEVVPPDSDGDGVPNGQDCAPNNASLQTPPGLVGSTVRGGLGGTTSYTWYRIPQANAYNIYRGTINGPFTFNHTCFEAASPDRIALDGDNPPVGQAFYYWVSGVSVATCAPEGGLGMTDPGPAGTPVARENLNPCAPSVADSDGDGMTNVADNCAAVWNDTQSDGDLDRIGNACDNCAAIVNPDQADWNLDGVGDHCQDSDGDTFLDSVDCNDQSASIYPGALEICNNQDDDCDGQVDEALGTLNCGVGACQASTPACINGSPQTCTPGTPTPETCNNVDDNCDGQVDNGLGTFACGVGACQRTANACVNGTPEVCTPGSPTAETCNNLDDDCNGQTDDGLGTLNCGVGACQASAPACVDGSPGVCVPGSPTAETCNNVDDNCDGQVDNGLGTITCGAGACEASAPACVDGSPGVCVPGTPTPETCNGIDDDCDGAIDNGLPDNDLDGTPDCLDPDDDNDQVPDGLDCAPFLAAVSAVPGVVGETLLPTPDAPAGDFGFTLISQAHVYNVYRGIAGPSTPGDYLPSSICRIAENPSKRFVDNDLPPLGQVYYYLITGTNRCGEGGPGAGVAAPPRNLPAACVSPGLDGDGDLVADRDDVCPTISDPGQADADRDLVGNACDNCPAVVNPDQVDTDQDGAGDACDP